MATYEEAGVNIEKGDECSRIAYRAAMATFASRKGMIGEPVTLEGGFAGLLDMGAFYLVAGDDGVGTKIELAKELSDFSTLGADLVAMVADDCICVGAETIAITNTIDIDHVDEKIIGEMMDGFSKACSRQKITIPGGEIAEVGASVTGPMWNATSVGVLEKEKFIDCSKVAVGDIILSLHEPYFRSNGFTLVRHILRNSGASEAMKREVLTPSVIYSDAVLSLIGRFGQPRLVDVHGVAHITGGGIPGNLNRALKRNQLGARLPDLFAPADAVLEIQRMGNVADEEAYKTWNMGNGMMLIVSPSEAEKAISLLAAKGVQAKVAGEVIAEPKITFRSCGVARTGEWLEFGL